jgi:hypothetical protein
MASPPGVLASGRESTIPAYFFFAQLCLLRLDVTSWPWLLPVAGAPASGPSASSAERFVAPLDAFRAAFARSLASCSDNLFFNSLLPA